MTVKTAWFWQLAVIGLGMVQALCAQEGVAKASRPNVILFLADDLGFGDLACHGNPHVKTPQLDAFSREAVEFTQFRVSPMCSPTRASQMKNQYDAWFTDTAAHLSCEKK